MEDCSQNNIENFFIENPDILEDEFSTRQTKSNTAIFSLEIANLPTITEKALPKWKKMKEHKKYKCMICGKKNLTPSRYDDQITSYHDACLQKPNLEEYCRARNMWIPVSYTHLRAHET